MKVSVKKANYSDVTLSRALVYKLVKILKPRFDYIVDHTPEANFFVGSNMQLMGITFASLDYEDMIRVDEEMVALELANGMHQLLFEHEGFDDLLRNVGPNDMYELEPEIKEYVAEQRARYKELLIYE